MTDDASERSKRHFLSHDEVIAKELADPEFAREYVRLLKAEHKKQAKRVEALEAVQFAAKLVFDYESEDRFMSGTNWTMLRAALAAAEEP